MLLKPPTYAFGTFVELWRELGGEFHGKLRIEAAAADARPFVTFDSLTLGEMVRLTNKFSNNLMARHLLLTLGEERYGAPATLDKGAAAIADWGSEHGFDLKDIDIDNGSGLSRTTHITALEMAGVLRAAYHSRFAPEFIASLPLAGIDGTLRNRMRQAPAGSVRLKTGHLDGCQRSGGLRDGTFRQDVRSRIVCQSPARERGRRRARARRSGGVDAGKPLISGRAAPCPREWP